MGQRTEYTCDVCGVITIGMESQESEGRWEAYKSSWRLNIENHYFDSKEEVYKGFILKYGALTSLDICFSCAIKIKTAVDAQIEVIKSRKP